MANILFIPECKKILLGMKEKTILNADGDFYKKSTIRTIEQTTTRIEEYIENIGCEITMSDIDFQFSENYRMYLIEKGHAKNTVSHYVSVLRFWIRRFHRVGLIEFSGIGIRCSQEITTAVFNTVQELISLYKLDLPLGQKRVIDIYICQCFLGLRVKDMFKFVQDVKLYQREINEKIFFEIKTEKTGEIVFIPASKIVLKILKDYDCNFGKVFSEQYYRRELKEIVSKSDFDREMFFHRTEGGERIERVVLFSELMGSHTARRSFATNAFLAGIPALDVMKITGHKSFNSFFKYIRADNLETAQRIASHEFFNIEI